MPLDMQCPMCGKRAIESCDGCGYWFCSDHLYRHRKCSQGK